MPRTTLEKRGKNPGKTLAFKPATVIAGLLLLTGFALSCGSLNVGDLQPQDICKCTALEPDISDYRHNEKHVPIPSQPIIETTISTIYTWAQPDPTSTDPPRTANELILYHITVAFLQEAHLNAVDCDVHFEISETPDKTAPRIIVETPNDSEFCSDRKNIQSQLAQHGFRLDANHGGELPQALSANVIGLAFEDFDHSAIGLGRGSAQVKTVWELHPAVVKLLP